jgi:hypothetical protein
MKQSKLALLGTGDGSQRLGRINIMAKLSPTGKQLCARCRELATVEQLQHATAISARMVHESFIAAEPTSASWDGVSEEKRARYEVMASRLNGYLLDAIRLYVACLEPGYVWSSDEE